MFRRRLAVGVVRGATELADRRILAVIEGFSEPLDGLELVEVGERRADVLDRSAVLRRKVGVLGGRERPFDGAPSRRVVVGVERATGVPRDHLRLERHAERGPLGLELFDCRSHSRPEP